MQKENLNNLGDLVGEDDTLRATSENQNVAGDGTGGTDEIAAEQGSNNSAQPNTSDNIGEFEELIRGPYKEAFAKKVQGIINKRFKERKNAEAKKKDQGNNPEKDPEALSVKPQAEGNAVAAEVESTDADDISDTFKKLISAGVDSDTAYQVLHLDEIMDASVRYGANMAAKSLADSIRLKAARPSESALNERSGFTARRGAAGLTPEKRKELAKKALMGEQIGF